ncbi:MAG: VOC family protein [Muricomes sp.]|uniref:VOC family protein n=1 Tax=Faecalicatena contorta TaxID=39482 RepID=UPI002EC8F38A|nr:VOC family protein [Muricomes sp.]
MEVLQGAIQLANFSHIGVAVKDADKTLEFLSSIWNIGKPMDTTIYTPAKEDLFYGEQFTAKLVQVKFGPFDIELLQPIEGNSIWKQFIDEKGEGIHHFAIGVSNYDEVCRQFENLGHKLLISAVFHGERWCYYSTSPGGMCIEIREEYNK